MRAGRTTPGRLATGAAVTPYKVTVATITTNLAGRIFDAPPMPLAAVDARAHVLHRGAVIIGAKGGLLRQITVGDVMGLLDAGASAHAKPMSHGSGFYRMLHWMGIFEAAAPQMLRELTASRQRTPAELIDRYDLACRPVRDLLVDYLKERQPALDYSSLPRLFCRTGRRVLERP